MSRRRDRHAEKLVGVVVTVAVPPVSINVISPSAAAQITYTPFPARDIASAFNAWRRTFHQSSTSWNKTLGTPMVARFLWAMHLPVLTSDTVATIRARRIAVVLAAFRTDIAASTSLRLGNYICTCHEHGHHHCGNHKHSFHSCCLFSVSLSFPCHIAKIRCPRGICRGFRRNIKGNFSKRQRNFCK